MDDRLEVAQRGRIGEHHATERRAVERPIGAKQVGPEPRDDRVERRLPGSRTSRATTSASMTTTPGRSPSHPATVDFPQPMGPVIPIRSARACSVDCSRVMAGV